MQLRDPTHPGAEEGVPEERWSLSSSGRCNRVSPRNFSRRGTPPIRLAPRPAHVAQAREPLATSGHLPSPGGPRVLPRTGGGVRGGQPSKLRPEEAARGSGAGVLPVHRPAARTGAPLTSWVRRAAAARRGRGEAAGFWPDWDMARRQGALPPGGRSGDWEGGCLGRGGAGGRAREAAFPTQPRARAGAARAPLGPPLPARCGL